MGEIERFFGNIVSGIVNRIRFGIQDSVDRQARELIDQQFEKQKQQPKPQDPPDSKN